MVVKEVISPMSIIFTVVDRPIHGFCSFSGGRKMTTVTPMTTGRDFDSPISNARCFPGTAQPQAAEHLVFPVSAPPTQTPGIHVVPLLASGGHTEDGTL